MKRNKLIPLLSLFVSFNALATNEEIIKQGVLAITTHAIEGPTVACEEESLKLSKKYYGRGADCSMFIDGDGKLGKLGKTIVSHIESIPDSQYYRNDSLGIQMACPNFPNLTKEQKAYYWVWLFAAISWKESTCGAATVNKAATHGTAAGMFQLNQNAKDRAWRSGTSGNTCGVPNIKPDEVNLKCSMEIMNEQLKGKNGIYEGNGTVFGRGANAYWQHLRKKDGGLIMKLVRDFPLCKK